MKNNQNIYPTQSLPITTHIKGMIVGIIVLSKSRLAFFRAEQSKAEHLHRFSAHHNYSSQNNLSGKMFNANLQPATVHSAAQTDAGNV